MITGIVTCRQVRCRHVAAAYPLIASSKHRRPVVNAWCMPCRQVRCRHVIVTCPLAVLQRGDMAFHPPLPAPKLAALNRVKMSNAIKVGRASPNDSMRKLQDLALLDRVEV